MATIPYESLLVDQDPQTGERELTAYDATVAFAFRALRRVSSAVVDAVASVANATYPLTGFEMDRVTLNRQHGYDEYTPLDREV